MRYIALALVTGPMLATIPARAADPDPKLSGQAFTILKKYCAKCHHDAYEVEGYDVLDHKSLVNPDTSYVVPAKPDKSELWVRVGVKGNMPPKKIQLRPSQEEKDVLKKWIEAGAPPFAAIVQEKARPFKCEKDALAVIHKHVTNSPQADRPFLRYFTLTNLHDNPAVTEKDLRLVRAALSKLANSLSWKPRIVPPKTVDPEQTVVVIDLRDYGWDQFNIWKEVAKIYPYGLDHETDPDEQLRSYFKDIVRETSCDLPYLRADWFISSASRPGLYHTILCLPDCASELERKLGVHMQDNYEKNKLARAGFAHSNISAQNRMVERHDALYGAYWKSYDFKPNNPKGNLFELPLGPAFTGNSFNRMAFEQDGGEIIFNLPNGLQAYLLVDRNDRRINDGPPDVVGDSTQVSGTTQIVNGLSCMACHNLGMKPFKDEIRAGKAVQGEARDKVYQLYPQQKKMDEYVKEDEERFQRSVQRATAGFLQADDDKNIDVRKMEEPIGVVALGFQRELALPDVAYELGYADPKELGLIIKNNRELIQKGLASLPEGGRIKRESWETIRGTSLFQQAARILDKGTPLRPID